MACACRNPPPETGARCAPADRAVRELVAPPGRLSILVQSLAMAMLFSC